MDTVVRYYEEVELGDEVGPMEVDITDDSVLAFCKVWGVESPNRFTDDKVAKDVRLPGPIVPGIMSMALMARLFADWSSRGTLKHLDVVFRQPVPHERVTITALVTDKREERSSESSGDDEQRAAAPADEGTVDADNVEYLVDCDVYLSNHGGDRLVAGKAIMSLPSQNR